MSTTAVAVSARGAAKVRGGHPWVRREDVTRAPARAQFPDDVVQLVDPRGAHLATALWCERSPIAARVIARAEVRLDEEWLIARVDRALATRTALLPGADAYRLVHGEADGLPGLFVDRYADVLVLQTMSAGMDARERWIAEVLARRLDARLVVARDDGGARDFEELPRRKGVLVGSSSTIVRFHDGGSLCETDVLEDGKTGSFLDQQENHARAGSYARPGMVALDAFTYHGGFALALARAGARVTALDENAQAVERARRNASLNATPFPVAVDVRCENAFDALRREESEGRRYDVVVVDPPALAKRKSALPAAERGYKELNLRAMRLLAPGGTLVTCSCSGRLTVEHFGKIVDAAARDSGRSLQLLERRGAGRDHPPLVGVPETEYLKCWVLRAID